MAIINSTIPRVLAQRSYLGQYKSWTPKRTTEISNLQKSESCGRSPNEYLFRFWLQNPSIDNKIGCSVPSQVLYILSYGQSYNGRGTELHRKETLIQNIISNKPTVRMKAIYGCNSARRRNAARTRQDRTTIQASCNKVALPGPKPWRAEARPMRLRALVASGTQASVVSTTSLGIQVFALVLRVGCRGGCLCVDSRRTKDIQINCNRTSMEGRKEKHQQVDGEHRSSHQITAGAAGRSAHAQGEGEGSRIPPIWACR